MDFTLEDLIKKSNITFDKIKGSTKRAEVLEALAKRAGVEADVVTVAMWETQWDDKAKEEDKAAPATAPEQPPAGAQGQKQVAFTDPVKGSVLTFRALPDGPTGMFYSVNGEPRPPFNRIALNVHSKSGPRLEFPELRTAATVPWECCQAILSDLAALANSRKVSHNIPANGDVSSPTTRAPAPTNQKKPVSYVETEGAMASLPAGMVGQLVSATFGDGYNQVSCMRNITGRLDQGGFAPFAVNAQNLGVADPSPGGPKKLEITYVPMSAFASPTSGGGTPLQGVQSPYGVPGTPPLPGQMSRFAPSSPNVAHLNDPQRSPHNPPMGLQRANSRGGDDDDDAHTDRSNTSYRHDPYHAVSQFTDGGSDTTSMTNSTRRNSELTSEDIARYAVPQNRPGRANVQARFGETLVVPPGTIARVVRAVYGEGDRWVLATNAAKRAFTNGGIPGLLVSEESLGVADPCPGKPKTLVVIYRPVEDSGRPDGSPQGAR
eukprot:TRINITY_DN31512_c0_g1_i1.p1 TRINITY_DN31512_c0_g1~~TRINITY_DN31512_c0_g1_i1.p1  ORF type:complete len:491 (+),score=169.89 TRINITY_DN31512_c0_g1_i1:396-1868(+)